MGSGPFAYLLYDSEITADGLILGLSLGMGSGMGMMGVITEGQQLSAALCASLICILAN